MDDPDDSVYWEIIGRLYTLADKQRWLGFPPNLTTPQEIHSEFLRRARLELFQDSSKRRQLQRRLRRAGYWDDVPRFLETIIRPSVENNKKEETPTSATTTATTGTTSTDDEKCKKRTVMDCYNNHNNKDDDQDLNDDDDNNNNIDDNINKISPSPKRLMTRAATRNEAEENKAILETFPTTTNGTTGGADSPAKPNETSLGNVRQSRTDPPGRCAGVVVPHSIRDQSVSANSGATGTGMPIHTIFQWCDSQLRERMTILVVLPTGVNTRYTVAVTGGTKLEIVFQWPEMSFNPDQVQELVQRRMEMERENDGNSRGLDPGTLQDHMIQHQEFRRHIQHLERQMDHRMESKVEIPLPKTVHAHGMEINAIGRIDDGTRMLYINLFCECTESIHKQQGTPFVLV